MQALAKRALRIALVIGVLYLLYYVGLSRYFNLESIRSYCAWFSANKEEQYVVTVLLFTIFFTALVACALPIVAPLALMGGYLFGTWQGALYSLIACVSGAAISFTWMKKFFKQRLKERYNARLERLYKPVIAHGSSYLLVLHYSVVMPMSLINTLAVLASLSLTDVMWTTAIGCFPILVVYSFAGRQLSTMTSVRDVLSPTILIMFAILALLAYYLPRLARRFN